MRFPGRSALMFLCVFLTFSQGVAFSQRVTPTPPSNFGRDTTLNGLSGHAIIPFALSRAHDRSPIQSVIEVRAQAILDLKAVLTGKTDAETNQKIRAFLSKLLALSEPTSLSRAILSPEQLADPLKNNPTVRSGLDNLFKTPQPLNFQQIEQYMTPLVRDVIPLPKQILSLDWNYRQVRDGVNQRDIVINAPSLLLSHRPTSLDLGFQHLPRGSMGVSARYHFYSFRTTNPNELTRAEADRWVKHAFKPNVAALIGYRNIPEFGHSFDYGLSFSKLFPLPTGHTRSGIMIQLAAQLLAINPRLAEEKSFLPFGVGISWQNEVPAVQQVIHGNETKFSIRRWSWRFAFEYGRIPLYPFDDGFGDAYAFVFRARDKGSGEYTFLFGKTANGDDYFGITLGTFIKWN